MAISFACSCLDGALTGGKRHADDCALSPLVKPDSGFTVKHETPNSALGDKLDAALRQAFGADNVQRITHNVGNTGVFGLGAIVSSIEALAKERVPAFEEVEKIAADELDVSIAEFAGHVADHRHSRERAFACICRDELENPATLVLKYALALERLSRAYESSR